MRYTGVGASGSWNKLDAMAVINQESAYIHMTASITYLDRIKSLLAEKGYEVSDAGSNVLKVREVTSGVAVQAVLAGDILYLSLTCTVVPGSAITADMMRKMLDSGNGISTSYFQLYDLGAGKVAVTLNNFCKLEDLGPEDEDDILSCVHFLLVDVTEARRLLGGLLQ